MHILYYYYIILLYFSAYMQCAKQALEIALHEALFKINKHTKKFTETLGRIVARHTIYTITTITKWQVVLTSATP